MSPALAHTTGPERLAPTITEVEHRVRELLRDFATRDCSPATNLALRHLGQFFDSGGKRIRPRMVLTGWRAADAACEPEQAICTAAAFEIIHNGILIQDDILDRSDYRRGTPPYGPHSPLQVTLAPPRTISP